MLGIKPEEGTDSDTDSTGSQASMPDPAPSQPNTRVDIPPWMPEDPRLWFQLVEDCFELQRSKEGADSPMPDRDKLIRIGAKLPGNIIRLHKAHYNNRNYEAFKNGVCGVAIKTDASLFRDFMGAKLTDGMSPSAYVQRLLVILGNLADNSQCRTQRKEVVCNPGTCGGDCGPGN